MKRFNDDGLFMIMMMSMIHSQIDIDVIVCVQI